MVTQQDEVADEMHVGRGATRPQWRRLHRSVFTRAEQLDVGSTRGTTHCIQLLYVLLHFCVA